MKKFIALSVMVLFCVAAAGCEKSAEEKVKDGAAEIKEGAKDAVDGALKK